MNFKGKTVLITGAANGIGKEIALSISKLRGFSLIADIDETNGVGLENEIRKIGGNAEFIYFDVSNILEIEMKIKEIIKKFNKIDILVNNAGICPINSYEKVFLEDWDNVLKINLSSIFFITKEVAKFMEKVSYGKIINISSISAKMGGVNVGPHYVASKGGLEALTRYYAKALAKFNINVNAVSATITATNLIDTWGKEKIKDVIKKIPLGRIGNVSDIANAVIFLASDESSFITGEIINVSGGMYMD